MTKTLFFSFFLYAHVTYGMKMPEDMIEMTEKEKRKSKNFNEQNENNQDEKIITHSCPRLFTQDPQQAQIFQSKKAEIQVEQRIDALTDQEQKIMSIIIWESDKEQNSEQFESLVKKDIREAPVLVKQMGESQLLKKELEGWENNLEEEKINEENVQIQEGNNKGIFIFDDADEQPRDLSEKTALKIPQHQGDAPINSTPSAESVQHSSLGQSQNKNELFGKNNNNMSDYSFSNVKKMQQVIKKNDVEDMFSPQYEKQTSQVANVFSLSGAQEPEKQDQIPNIFITPIEEEMPQEKINKTKINKKTNNRRKDKTSRSELSLPHQKKRSLSPRHRDIKNKINKTQTIMQSFPKNFDKIERFIPYSSRLSVIVYGFFDKVESASQQGMKSEAIASDDKMSDVSDITLGTARSVSKMFFLLRSNSTFIYYPIIVKFVPKILEENSIIGGDTDAYELTPVFDAVLNEQMQKLYTNKIGCINRCFHKPSIVITKAFLLCTTPRTLLVGFKEINPNPGILTCLRNLEQRLINKCLTNPVQLFDRALEIMSGAAQSL